MMSDTSGGGGLGSAGRQIRLNLKGQFGGGPRSAAGEAVLPAIIWQPLEDQDLLDALLLPSELLYYLQQMATFVETARRSGLEAVAQAFGVREASTFPSVRRVIKIRAPGNSGSRRQASEHHDRAGAAFDSGSARWAQEITGIDDPTQIPVTLLIDRIRAGDDYGRALKLSARLIIQEYGQRVIRAAIREDDTFRRAADKRLISEFHAQLDRFFARHDSPSAWTSARIPDTAARLPEFLKR
jgi:hypothetical protein